MRVALVVFATGLAALLSASLSGCAVVSVVDTAATMAGVAVSVTTTAVTATGKVVGAGADAVSSDDDDDDSDDDDSDSSVDLRE